MARSGQASVDVVADFSKFAAQFQKDMNAALRGITINMSDISNQISNGVRQGVNAANQELSRLGGKSGEAFSTITRQSSAASKSMAASFASAGREMSNVGDQMTMSLTLPIAAAGAFTARAAGNFEQMMNRVMAATEATGPVFEKMRQQAINLGATTAYSATEAAQAMQILATAGFNTAQIMDAVPAVLNMAAAGAVDLAVAAEIGSSILNGFGFSAKDLTRVNDVLARTFMATATDLTDLGNSFKYVGPLAKGVGLSFEETSAAIGLMGNAGIRGEMAGTALRGALVRLMTPTKDVTEVLGKLGVSVKDSAGNLLPLIDIVKKLEAAGASTGDIMQLFGQEAGPGMAALISQGSVALAGLTTQLRNSGGTADRVAKTQMQGLNAQLDNLSGAAESLMIAIGDAGLLSVMTRAAAKATEFIGSLSKASPVMMNIVVVSAAVLAAAGPLLAIFGRLAIGIGEGILAIRKFGSWALRVAPWLTALSGPVGWVIAAVVALTIAAVVAYKKCEAFRTIVDRAFRAVGAAAVWMWQNAILPAFNAIVTWATTVGNALVKLWGQAQPVLAAWGSAMLRVWNSAIRPALGQIGGMFSQAGSALSAFWTGTAQPALSAMMSWFGNLAVAIRSWWVGNGDTVMKTAAQVVAWVGGVVTTVWTGVMAVFKAVAAVIVWVVVNVAIPLFKALIAVVGTIISAVMKMKPIWVVLGAIIVAAVMIVVAVVKVLWSVLVAAFNAIGAVVQWLWSSVVLPVFSAIGTVIQAAGAVVQWLWSSVIQPVFMAIATAVGMVGTVIMWLWSSVFVPAFNAIGAVVQWLWSSVIQPVFSFIGSAIGVVVSIAMWFWNTFSPIFIAIGNLLWTIWSGTISIVFDLLKLAFMTLWGVVQLWWANVKVTFAALAGVVMWIWGSIFSPILAAIGALFGWLWGVIQPVLAAVGAMFTWLWTNAISPFATGFAAILTWLWGVIVAIFNSIVTAVRTQIGYIVMAANGLTAFVNSISSHFQSVVNAIRDKLNTAINFVRALPGQIISAIGNLGSLLYNAGQNVINGLINGISNRIGALRSKISEAASAIRNALPFSPAKEGPLSGKGDPTIAGGKIVTMVAAGMERRAPALRAAAWNVANSSLGAPAGGIAGGLAPLASATVGRGGANVVFGPGSINVTFSGVTPTSDQARATGAAVGQGIIVELTRSKTASLVRSI